jgi:hypothetical protein
MVDYLGVGLHEYHDENKIQMAIFDFLDRAILTEYGS